MASWRTICPGEVRMFDPVGTTEKHGFDAATSDANDTFQSILKIKMVTARVNGNEMAWVCENHFGSESDVQTAYSIETFAWDDDESLLIKTYYPMPETVDSDSDPYAHLLGGQQWPRRGMTRTGRLRRRATAGLVASDLITTLSLGLGS